jgi:hypothetical protein
LTNGPSSRVCPDPAGCYGFRLSGLDGAGDLMVDASTAWPLLRIGRAPLDGPPPELDRIGTRRAELPLQSGGWVALDRALGTATFRLPRSAPDRDIVHPYLAPAAAVAARWAGRESFHAGALIAGGGAWAMLGDKETGKSSTLAWLALQGRDILTDDLLVLDGATGFAGPRCIDLRADAADHLAVGEPLGVVGLRERWRVVLGPVPAETQLRGWVTLAWDDDIAVDPLGGPERLLALMACRSVRLEPAAPEALVDLSSLPVWRLRRPRDWDALPEAAARLLDVLDS